MIIRDPVVLAINDDLRDLLRSRRVGIVHVYLERYGDPEPGPYVDETDLPDKLKEILRNNGIRRLYKFQWYKEYRQSHRVFLSA